MFMMGFWRGWSGNRGFLGWFAVYVDFDVGLVAGSLRG